MRNRFHAWWRSGVLMAVLGVLLTAFPAGPGAATAATRPAPPAFQLPFPCGTTWELHTYGGDHSPALDIFVEGNTGSDGLPVLASAAGTVSATYWDNGSGNTVQISHGNGWFTAYYHLMDAPATYVKKGDPVTPSTPIGRIGKTGRANDWAHLHHEQRYAPTGDFTYEKDRVPARFDGVEYSGLQKSWPKVTSRNCTGGPAAAWQDCPSGSVCFYSGADGTGTVCRSAVDEPASTCGPRRSYFNNGTEEPGADHVQVSFREGGGQCLHYGWAEGRGNLPAGGRTIDSFRWRGEC
ncbi:peptidoglycan DD-metalloendopeptidase family protein [Kitasatospora sp. NPDC056327]|uniref:peptidoglycan DD-metalloendopeptidase family protein n=1 Tax=Kitasatospora sp. NPDC056327 TaxID=3345785 RepID=UPI0035D6B96E